MLMTNIPSDKDRADNKELSEAEAEAARVGSRIRKIRTEKGLSREELGRLVDLSADRIQRYENGFRKPRAELLAKIADALGVSPLALSDPDTTTYVGMIYAFFEAENLFGMEIEQNDQGALCLTANYKNEIYQYLDEWEKVYAAAKMEVEAASSTEEKKSIISKYHDWEWNFPARISKDTQKEAQKMKIKKRIEALQKAYDKLDEK